MFQSKALQNLPKLVFLELKINHPATLFPSPGHVFYVKKKIVSQQRNG
jgi:hypothetical protein